MGDLSLHVRQKPPADTPNIKPDAAPPEDPQIDYALEIEPRTLALTYGGTPLRFEEVSGRATVRPGHIELTDLAGVFPTGRATVNGDLSLDPDAPTVLGLTATTNLPCPVAQAVLPAAVIDVLHALEMRGGVTVSDARLMLRPETDGEPHDQGTEDAANTAGPGDASTPAYATEFDGRLGLHDVGLTLGLPVTGVNGGMLARVRTGDGRAHPELSFDLKADTAVVSDRVIGPLTLQMHNEDFRDTLTLRPLLGSVYGGVLVGEGSVPLAGEQPCRVRLSLTDVAAMPFLLAGTEETQPTPTSPPRAFADAARSPSQGLLSAGLNFEVPLDRPDQPRGRGVLRIRDARLVDRPIGNAILRATNLSLPSSSPLDRASARYLLNGDTVRFDELSISGPGLSISGAGTMTLPDQNLRLLMVSRSSDGPSIGPLTDLFEMFRDELIAIKVRGTLSEPTTEVTALSGIRKSIRTLFIDE